MNQSPRHVAAGVITLSLLLSGCLGDFVAQDNCDLSSPPPVKTLSEPDHEQVSGVDANVGLVLNNSGPPSRVTVLLDEKTLLDVELPDDQDCVHSPVYSHYYRLPGGKV